MSYPSRDELEQRLREHLARAYDRAPAVTRILDEAGIDPSDITVDDLAEIPVTTKERLLEMQREDPPFGGFLGVDMADLQHVFVSPGPLFDPVGPGHRGLGFQHAFRAAGIGADDIVLNTWSYHLVPAGLAMDEALTEIGATVIPGGVGNTEQQAQLIVQLGVTAISASTGFFVALAEKLEELGHDLPADWNVRVAFLGGEFGDWMAKRRRIEERFGIRTTSAYATGDLGTVGFECEEQDGYHLTPNLIVQVCDPDTGTPRPDGEVGHVVATAFNDAYPLVRFGTGDLSMMIPEPCPCGRIAPRLAPLQGRVGLAVKAREIFVYPLHVTDLTARVREITRAQAVVRRPGSREEILLRLELTDGADEAEVRAHVEEEFRSLTRLGIDEIEVLPTGSIAGEEPFVVDQKDA